MLFLRHRWKTIGAIATLCATVAIVSAQNIPVTPLEGTASGFEDPATGQPAFAFDPQTDVEPGSLAIATPTVTVSGLDGGAVATASGDGTPRFRVNDGPLVQVEAVQNDDVLELSLQTDPGDFEREYVATLDIDGTSANFTVTTRAAPLLDPNEPDPCETGPLGSVCADGAIYAGDLPNGARFFMASADEPGLLQFATEVFSPAFSMPVDDLVNDGLGNRAHLQVDNPGRVFPASNACAARGPQWYLPSYNEISAIFNNASHFNGAGLADDGTAYWSSSIRLAMQSGANLAFARSLTNILGTIVDNERSVRCVRSGNDAVIPAASSFNLEDMIPGEIIELPIYSVYARGIADLSISGDLALTVSGLGANNVTSQQGFHLSPRLVLRATVPTEGAGPFTSQVRLNDQLVATVTVSLYEGEDCTTGPVGSRCADGSFYAGLTGGDRFYVAPFVEGVFRFSTSGTVPASEISSLSDGLRNTLVLLAREQSEIYEAAQACRARGKEWYVPSRDELGIMISGIQNFPSWFIENEFSTLLWTSSANNNSSMWTRRASTPINASGVSPASSLPVLCVRTELDILAGIPEQIQFPDVIAYPGAQVTSDAGIIMAGRSTAPIPFTVSGDGDPLVSVMGGSFVASGFVSPGENVRIRMTSSETEGVTRTATLSIGGVDSTFNVTTSPDCRTGPVGSVCEDGALFAGTTVGGARMYVAPDDEPSSLAWKTEATASPGSTSLADGFSNTLVLVNADGSHPAAEACQARGSAWYLPALDEMETLFDNRDDLVQAGFSTSIYWSSSEATDANARRRLLTGTTSGTTVKTAERAVRCVRTDEEAPVGTPAPFSFSEKFVATDLVVESDPDFLTGLRNLDPLPISVTGEGGPEISIGGGAFTTTGTIVAGQSVVVRLRSAPDADVRRSATVTVAGVDSVFEVLTSPDCTTGPVGSVCADGALFAGTTIGGSRMYVAPADHPVSLPWKTENTFTASTASLTDGFSNTAVMLGDAALHPAAAACGAMGPEWYLPARDELTTLFNNRVALAQASFTSGSQYWSSSQASATQAIRRILSGTTVGNTNKDTSLLVRCVRTETGEEVGTPDVIAFPGSGNNFAPDSLAASGAGFVTGLRSFTPVPVSVSGDGNPQISINGGPFVTSGTVSAGQSIVVRLTAAPPSGSRTATVDILGVTSSFTAVSTEDCTTGPIGSICPDGAFYAGTTVGNARMYVAPADEPGTLQWKTSNTDTPGTTSLSDGFLNTAVIVGDSDIHPAADACRARGPEWYLPARDELTTLFNNRVALAQASFTSGSQYWSSSQASATQAVRRILSGTTTGNSNKTTSLLVRCVRSEIGGEVGSPTLGTFGSVNAAADMLRTSRPATVTGLRTLDAVPISVSGEGNPEISIDGGPFITEGTISLAQSVVIRLRSSPDVGVTRTATVDVAGFTRSFSVTTNEDCTTGPVGSVCSDGAIFAGLTVNDERMYLALEDEAGTFAWKTSNSETPGATSFLDGFSNTAALMNDSGSHPAAEACRARGPEWYLPARGEMTVIWDNRSDLLASAAYSQSETYWTSTESSGARSHIRRLNTNVSTLDSFKTDLHLVRCMRTELDAGPGAPSLDLQDMFVVADTLVMSEPVFPSGIRNLAPVPVSVSGDGNPEISIDGGAFATSGTITAGQQLVIRATSGSPGVTRAITVDIGGMPNTFNIESSQDCTTGPIGSVCADGAFFAGVDGTDRRLYVAPQGETGTFTWQTAHLLINSTSLGDGEGNTALIAAQNAVAPAPAAMACVQRGEGWFLPAFNQLNLIRNNRASLPRVSFVAGRHWSSSEASTAALFSALTSSNTGNISKQTLYPVHCARH